MREGLTLRLADTQHSNYYHLHINTQLCHHDYCHSNCCASTTVDSYGSTHSRAQVTQLTYNSSISAESKKQSSRALNPIASTFENIITASYRGAAAPGVGHAGPPLVVLGRHVTVTLEHKRCVNKVRDVRRLCCVLPRSEAV